LSCAWACVYVIVYVQSVGRAYASHRVEHSYRTVIIALPGHAAAAAASTATQQHPRARSVRASPRLCMVPTVPIILHLPSQAKDGVAGPATLIAPIRCARRPSLPHRPAGCCIPAHAVGVRSVSAKTSREGVFLDSPPACCEVGVRVVLTQAPAEQEAERTQTTVPALHPSRTPH
jgi:hypothetical protein